MISLLAFKFDPFRNAPSSFRIVFSPLMHADYLHLCLNIFGGFLVLNQLEEAIGKKRTVVISVDYPHINRLGTCRTDPDSH